VRYVNNMLFVCYLFHVTNIIITNPALVVRGWRGAAQPQAALQVGIPHVSISFRLVLIPSYTNFALIANLLLHLFIRYGSNPNFCYIHSSSCYYCYRTCSTLAVMVDHRHIVVGICSVTSLTLSPISLIQAGIFSTCQWGESESESQHGSIVSSIYI
jgi:hypothetical protein